MDQVAGWLRDADCITVLTGAGISTDSGIPDYRGPNGVWTKNPGAERMSTLQDYVADPEVRRRSWQSRRDHPVWRAEPNAGHRALADLEKTGKLFALVTQNIDGLHQRAGSTNVIEVHGTVHWAECLTCGVRTPMADQLARVEGGDPDPACTQCGGILKSATISFGENLVAADLERAGEAAAGSDLFLALGTSLGVYPAAGLPEIALRNGAVLIVMNAEPTPFDRVAEAVVRTPLGEALPALVERLSE
jgi:NAD-dependent deacetylase